VKDRINWTYLRALDRKPTFGGVQIDMDDLYQKQIDRYTHNPDNAAKLISAGETAGGEGPQPVGSGRLDFHFPRRVEPARNHYPILIRIEP
jgi:hypothetical protein